MKPDLAAEILRRIATLIEEADEAQLKEFLAKIPKLKPGKEIRSKKTLKNENASDDLGAILNRVISAPNRDVGMDILEKSKLNKNQLTRMAKIQSIYVSKSDNIGRIKEKIVESTVGARLRSNAVRGAMQSKI
ncbi:hypothetical protein UF64_04320 [Thalassospira sp. HJ]|uniref:hypothetical protein n=1 Tax=Thalassospira sp. HJ TaxID=1616823 RepID=UPI0005CEC67C|nr:hypothetical protein [Thalassospira sp. HJ]KJE36379.1 hypothetical protein UF64_04320 [Thalassospira sp. HJ]